MAKLTVFCVRTRIPNFVAAAPSASGFAKARPSAWTRSATTAASRTSRPPAHGSWTVATRANEIFAPNAPVLANVGWKEDMEKEFFKEEVLVTYILGFFNERNIRYIVRK